MFPAFAERLPIRVYSTSEGLSGAFVNRIVRDSRGFLWFCTRSGLSRFDGYTFVNYGTEQGLPQATINALLESRDGVYWIATNGGGIARFDPHASELAISRSESSSSHFKIYSVGDSARANRVNALCEDLLGRIWAATDNGIFRLDDPKSQSTFRTVELGVQINEPEDLGVNIVVADRDGSVWVGLARRGLCRIDDTGHIEQYSIRDGLPSTNVLSLLVDNNGHVWVGTSNGLCLVTADHHQPSVGHTYTTVDGLANNRINALFQSSDGKLWIGSNGGLTEFDGTKCLNYTTAQGLIENVIGSLAEDTDGNIWMGTAQSGAMKLKRAGLTAYTTADGAGLTEIHSIVESASGELYFMAKNWWINDFDGARFISSRPAQTLALEDSWLSQYSFVDHTGEWWVLTDNSLMRFGPIKRIEQLAHARPNAIYSSREGLSSAGPYRVFEDSRGDLWFGTNHGAHGRLTRWERATNTFHPYSEADDFPAENSPFSFCEDRQGDLWIGFYEGSIGRFRDGRFTLISADERWPKGMITSLFLDHVGRLWITSNSVGVSRVDDPSADHPTVINYTTANGLSTNDTRCVTEDQWDRIYIGTTRGIDRLEPDTGRVRHYTVADGLSNDFVHSALRDHRGWLWFGTMKGLSRLIPEPDRPQPPPPVVISGLRIAGAPLNLSELGENEITNLELKSDQNQIQIDFTGLSEMLRFQYKLEGADRDWNTPVEHRTVNYARLSPGSYRFLVRAINPEGLASERPASLAFTILPPLWQRWWFLTLAVVISVLMMYALYRYRLRRLIELERVRTRIASDLHDDIGSSLSQIAVLSEVLRKQIVGRAAEFSRPLAQIARVSREAVDSMSDIVWAINPEKDHLYDLTRRMRRFVSEVLPARGIDFRLSAPSKEQSVRLGADLRRQVFLIFKEGINNLVRHSQCLHAEIVLHLENGWLMLEIKDDGCGFETSINDGNGLPSLQRRACAMGGELKIDSHPGTGTVIMLRVPYKSHRFGSALST
ncbi:MAG TPA: two-component regulator propeller domain-containing protein [Pyrinomonadaceae bacterium]|nr:two-component regulator propeller domain-containing protein [Pyrinomonadaceae bacterium]